MFWIGLLVVFHFTFSGTVTNSGHKKRANRSGLLPRVVRLSDPGGDHLGAATGMMWHGRGMSFRAANAKMRLAS
ncbi:hypothetical protein ACN6LA_003064 [Streptomyces sp. SAS_269]|uniref:hypothetical protein n=1 Tax=Streptomyces sp. SAS_269 TaxID=3412749 RepID=UPI00403D3EF8